jgi:hypothetical protein
MIKMEEKIWEMENLLDIESSFQEVTEVNTGMTPNVWGVTDLDLQGFDNISILSGYPLTDFLSLSWSDDSLDLADFWGDTPEYTIPFTIESTFSQNLVAPEDVDLFDNVSIPIPVDEIFGENKEKSWNSIIKEIELAAAQGIFDNNMLDSPSVPDMNDDFSHSASKLIKGNNEKANVKRMLRKLGKKQPATFDIFAYNEDREFHSAAKPEYNIPLRVSIEKGDMVFRLKLSSVGMGDLKRLQAIPGFSKTVAHFPRTIHASLEDEELRLVVPRFRSRRTAM